MIQKNKYQHLLSDFGSEIKEMAINAKNDLSNSSNIDNSFLEGSLFSLYKVLDTLKQLAESLGVTDEEISLNDIDVDSFI